MIAFFKKYWFFILLATIATLLGILWFNKKAPEAPKVELPQNIEGFELIGQNIANSTTITIGPTQGYKNSLPLLTIERTEPLDTNRALQIAAYFGINTQPQAYNDAVTGEILLWSVNEHSLTITTNTNEISYGRNLELYPSPIIGSFNETNNLLQKAQGIFSLAQIKLDNISSEEILLNKVGEKHQEGEAAVYKFVSLSSTFEGLDVIQYTGQGSVATIWFDSIDRIVKFSSTNSLKALNKSQKNIPLRPVEEIASDLKTIGRIFSLEDTHSPILPEDLVTINISQITTAYFVPRTGQYAHPVFVLEGVAEDTQGMTRKIKLLFPAAKKEIYKEN